MSRSALLDPGIDLTKLSGRFTSYASLIFENASWYAIVFTRSFIDFVCTKCLVSYYNSFMFFNLYVQNVWFHIMYNSFKFFNRPNEYRMILHQDFSDSTLCVRGVYTLYNPAGVGVLCRLGKSPVTWQLVCRGSQGYFNLLGYFLTQDFFLLGIRLGCRSS